MKNVNNITSMSEIREGKGIWLVDCWATWCGPCKGVDLIMQEAVDGQDVIIAKANTDNNPQIVTDCNIMTIPTILFFTNGNLVDRITGRSSKDQMIHDIQKKIQECKEDLK